MGLEEIGIVVIGRNEGSRLSDCFSSIALNRSSIVYVDSGSTDGSAEMAERLKLVVVRLNPELPFTAARARNEGFTALLVQQPSVRFVQFVDGDCLLVETWIDAALAFLCEHDDVAVVCGRRRERYPEHTIYNAMSDREWNTPVGETLACGGDSLVRVEAFQAVEGFRSELMAGEEPDLCARLINAGWRIWRLDAEMTVHDMAMTRFRQWWVRAVRGGYGYAEVCALHRGSTTRPFFRNVVRALFWATILPVAICAVSLVYWQALFCFIIYPLQVLRIAARGGLRNKKSWIFAFFLMVAKFAEMQGILRYVRRRWFASPVKLIEYKTNLLGS
jgi:GT2 family glycosyltransferase